MLEGNLKDDPAGVAAGRGGGSGRTRKGKYACGPVKLPALPVSIELTTTQSTTRYAGDRRCATAETIPPHRSAVGVPSPEQLVYKPN
jgi:hypothetical protein